LVPTGGCNPSAQKDSHVLAVALYSRAAPQPYKFRIAHLVIHIMATTKLRSNISSFWSSGVFSLKRLDMRYRRGEDHLIVHEYLDGSVTHTTWPSSPTKQLLDMLSILYCNPVSMTFEFSVAAIAMLANTPVLHQYTAENTNYRRLLFALDDLRKLHHTAQETNT
jgi:hypothetical protein